MNIRYLLKNFSIRLFLVVVGLTIIIGCVSLSQKLDSASGSISTKLPTLITKSTVKPTSPLVLPPISQFASEPAWTQNFTSEASGSLDPSYWTYDLGDGSPDNPQWGNSEAEYYTSNPNNVAINNGLLTITALQQAEGGQQYTSARIKTDGLIDFEYGKLDVVAKLPTGIGTWPAIWLLPQDDIYYNESTSSDPLQYLNDGEIDIMEEVGAIPGQVSSSAQSRSYNPMLNDERVGLYQINDATTAFHDYGLQWTPNQLIFSVDGIVYHTVNRNAGDTYLQWPYDQPYYLIINLAMGGIDGGIDSSQYPPDGIDNSSLPATFDIQSISYYKYTGS